jgi:hypothetical protein
VYQNGIICVPNKEMAPAVRQHPEARTKRSKLLIEASVARSAHEEPPETLVECFRHKGEECPRCDGSGFRPRKHCAGCGEPAGRPSQGGKALIGLRNRRGSGQLMYCLGCHPEHGGTTEDLTMLLERMGG